MKTTNFGRNSAGHPATAPDSKIKGAPPIRVRFIGAEGRLNSVSMLAERVHHGLSLIDAGVTSEVLLLPPIAFKARLPVLHQKQWEQMIDGVDIAVIVKSSAFFGFDSVAPFLKSLARSRNILLVSSPADGVEAMGEGSRDRFSEEIADFVIADSEYQRALIAAQRDPNTVLYIPPATRPVSGRTLEVRDRVRTVIWENPPHHDPKFKAVKNGETLENYQAFEAHISELCRVNGADLKTFGVWRDVQDDREWEDTLLAADVAIECKSVGRHYTRYQLGKPATKVQNYMALGMPVICDSLPAYREVGGPAGVLFADSFEEWEQQLGKLFASPELRHEMSMAASRALAPLSVQAIAQRYADCFAQMLESTSMGARNRWRFDLTGWLPVSMRLHRR